MLRWIQMLLAGLAWLLPAEALWAQHTHGIGQLGITQDGPVLQLALTLPLESAVGFERAPRTAAERQRAGQALARLRLPGGGFQPDAAAACQPHSLTLETGPLGDGGHHAPGPHDGHEAHADIEVHYRFECAQPARLRAVLTDVFEAWPRLQGLEVQLATPRGQWRQSLRRPQRSIVLVR